MPPIIKIETGPNIDTGSFLYNRQFYNNPKQAALEYQRGLL